jgi:hypothetical protein
MPKRRGHFRPRRPYSIPKLKFAGALKQVPEGLVVDGVVELDFAAFDDASQLTRGTVGGGLLQVGVAALHVGA